MTPGEKIVARARLEHIDLCGYKGCDVDDAYVHDLGILSYESIVLGVIARKRVNCGLICHCSTVDAYNVGVNSRRKLTLDEFNLVKGYIL